jgi:nucleotide-binding universal stress UspA family protein
VVRGLHKPILSVTAEFSEPRRVLIAFDGGGVTRRGVEMVAASPLFKGLPVHLLMSGKAQQDAPKQHEWSQHEWAQLEWAKKTLASAGFDVSAELIPGDAESVIARYVKEQEIDMLIIGAYSHSPLRRLLFGSKTADLLRSSRIPTLLLR